MPNKQFWKVENKVNGDAEILLYGNIAEEKSWFGNEASPKQFADDLEKLNGKDVTVRIHSRGGDVFAAHAIHNLLASYKGNVTVMIDGICASAASIVAVAGNKIIMANNTLLMIHDPMAGMNSYYNAAELIKMAEALDTIKTSIVAAYRKKTKLSEDKLTTMMSNETWMGPKEAKTFGFIDEISGETAKATLNGNTLIVNSIEFDLDGFDHPEEITNKLNFKEDKKVSEKSKFAELLNSLGLKFADDDQKPAEPVKNVAEVSTLTAATAVDKQAIIAEERKRIEELDAVAKDGNESVVAIINEAKKSGQTLKEVEPYINAVKDVKPTNAAQDLVKNLVNDNKKSGVENVASGASGGGSEAEQEIALQNNMAKVIDKKLGFEVKQ